MALFSPESPTGVWHDDTPIRIGVSSCLLGQRVRWDGGHKRDAFVCEELAPYFEWVSVCPEVELGLSVPRETLRLEQRGDGAQLIATGSGCNLTAPMRRFAERRARALLRERLCGYVLKGKSPSCGMERVRVWNETGQPERRGRGVFAEALLANHPTLPVEEEGRLRDSALRERFLERVFAAHRLLSLFSTRWSRGRLVAFHAAHKLLLMAHSQTGARKLGGLVARAKTLRPAALRDAYVEGFSDTLSHPATRKRHTNVLQHIQGYFRKRLDAADRRELEELIDRYRQGLVPLVVPITLLRHHVRREQLAFLADQVYLEPHPAELMLRNHV